MRGHGCAGGERGAGAGVFFAALRCGVLAASGFLGCAAAPETAGRPDVEVRPGIEVLLADSSHLVDGRRVGLITNRSGVGRDGTSSIDLLHRHEGAELVALFAPEHGIRGTEAPGAAIGDETDAATGIPVFSLYGATLEPTPEMLAGIDVLAVDLQDIGARYYTYVSTMARAMAAAGRAGVPLIVLDRPNPIGGLVQGPVLDPAFASFVGMYPVPVRHGLTSGELARLYQGEFGVEVGLHVIPAAGWTAQRWFDDTRLPWIAPSPNMPSIESAAHYPGTCLFEGTNISVGRGTDAAFQLLGAPWLDGAAWAAGIAELAGGAAGLPGVEISVAAFTPASPGDGKFEGEEVSGIRLTVTDRATYDPVRTAAAALVVARRLSGAAWAWRESHFDRLAGTDELRLAIERGASLDEITAGWVEGAAAFRELARPYLLYPR